VPFTLRELRRTFTGKLGCEVDAAARHPTFVFRHQGQIIAKTHISHGGGRDVPDGVIGAMARQIGVTGPQLRAAITCSLSADGLVAIILGSRGRT
jgi:hypothetical protein